MHSLVAFGEVEHVGDLVLVCVILQPITAEI
jgi:hypothetical protein